MIDCVYIGDSIAVGLQQLEHRCAVHAMVGASSTFITKHYKGYDATDHAVISMGSNDPYSPDLLENAIKLRKSLHVKTVIWILPYNKMASANIQIVARLYGDIVVDLSPIPTKDGIHPNYERVHERIRNISE